MTAALERRRHIVALRDMAASYKDRAQRALDAPGQPNYRFYCRRRDACRWVLRELDPRIEGPRQVLDEIVSVQTRQRVR